MAGSQLPDRKIADGQLAAPVICIPEEHLAAEIELAIAYAVACNRDRAHEMLLTPPAGCRGEFAGQVAAMLAERAGKGLSGMAAYEIRVPGRLSGSPFGTDAEETPGLVTQIASQGVTLR